MRDKVLSLLKQHGPMLPVEIGSKLGIDSFMAKAFLADLVESGEVKISKEKLAESNMYYLPGQDSQVQVKMSQITVDHNKTARTYGVPTVSADPKLQAKRDAFTQRLREIEEAELKRRAKSVSQPPPSRSISRPTPRQVVMPIAAPQPRPTPIQRPSLAPVKAPICKSMPPPPMLDKAAETAYEPEAKRTFLDQAMDWLRMEGTEIIEELSSKKNEMELIVNVYTDFGKVNFYMKIKNKKSITEADLMAIYAGAMENKCPAVLVTNGNLAKSAEAFLDEKGWIIKVKKL